MNRKSRATAPQEEYVLEILRSARLLESQGEGLFRPYRLTLAQFNVLNLLSNYEPMQQSDLNQAMVVGKATVSSVVAGLIKRRLVSQTADKKDRRAKVLSLTLEGRRVWGNASRAYSRGLEERLPTIDRESVQAVKDLLAPCRLLCRKAV